MSIVTNVMLSGILDPEQEKIVEQQLENYTISMSVPRFKKINPREVGGDKVLETSLYIAAINNFDVKSFANCIKPLSYFHNAEDIQLFFMDDSSAVWSIYLLPELTDQYAKR